MARVISENLPDIGVIGEEGTAIKVDSNIVVIIDPIDGTSVHTRGHSLWSTCVGVRSKNEGYIAGSVYCPVTGKLIYGIKGVGVWRANLHPYLMLEKQVTSPIEYKKGKKRSN